MSETRIKIDLSQGLVEVEGNEAFVRSIYEDFKERIQAAHYKPGGKPISKAKGTSRKSPSTAASKQRKRKASANTPMLVKDLDLTGGKSHKSLRDFYKQYAPENNMENNLIFAYYLQHEIEFPRVTIDCIFTCYRNISSLKVPRALTQSLVDTAKHKGWLDTSSLSDIKVPVAGMNYIEHDMKKASN
jgi:hypothetical protein